MGFVLKNHSKRVQIFAFRTIFRPYFIDKSCRTLYDFECSCCFLHNYQGHMELKGLCHQINIEFVQQPFPMLTLFSIFIWLFISQCYNLGVKIVSLVETKPMTPKPVLYLISIKSYDFSKLEIILWYIASSTMGKLIFFPFEKKFFFGILLEDSPTHKKLHSGGVVY